MISQQQTFLSFTHKMAAKTSWNEIASLSPMYSLIDVISWRWTTKRASTVELDAVCLDLFRSYYVYEFLIVKIFR